MRIDTFTFKCSDAERAMILALALRLERTQSDAVRLVLREYCEKIGLWPLPEKPDGKP